MAKGKQAAPASLPGMAGAEIPQAEAREPAGEGRGISAEALRSLAALREWVDDDGAFAGLFGGDSGG